MSLSNLLFIDIETVSAKANFRDLPEHMQQLWSKKTRFIRQTEEDDIADLYTSRAAIYAEFGKIISIAVGFFVEKEGQRSFRVTDISNDNEQQLLQEFKSLIEEKFDQKRLRFCAHNGKEFDYPYLCRRMLIQGISLPKALQLSGKKPWEISHLDTLEMWKFGDYKHFTSLDLLAAIFGLPTSKDDIDGSQVGTVYYEQNDLDRIATYCKKDVILTARLYLKLQGSEELKDDCIVML